MRKCRPFLILPRFSRTPLGWTYLRWGRGKWLFSDTRLLRERMAAHRGALPS